MPPKKDAEKKKAPAKAPEKPGGAETGKDSPGMFDALAASPGFKKIVLAVTILLIACAVLTIILYTKESAKSDKLFNAVGDIRNFMIKENYASRTMDDPQILKEAKKLADLLSKWNEDNDEVGNHIEDIQSRIKAGWLAFRGHIYLFTAEKENYNFAKVHCGNSQSFVIDVQSPQEQKFLEDIVKRKTVPYWLGIRRIRRDWTWDTGDVLTAPNIYWMRGNPKPIISNDQVCAVIVPCGQETLKCWKEVKCEEKNPWICKKAPNPKFNS